MAYLVLSLAGAAQHLGRVVSGAGDRPSSSRDPQLSQKLKTAGCDPDLVARKGTHGSVVGRSGYLGTHFSESKVTYGVSFADLRSLPKVVDQFISSAEREMRMVFGDNFELKFEKADVCSRPGDPYGRNLPRVYVRGKDGEYVHCDELIYGNAAVNSSPYVSGVDQWISALRDVFSGKKQEKPISEVVAGSSCTVFMGASQAGFNTANGVVSTVFESLTALDAAPKGDVLVVGAGPYSNAVLLELLKVASHSGPDAAPTRITQVAIPETGAWTGAAALLHEPMSLREYQFIWSMNSVVSMLKGETPLHFEVGETFATFIKRDLLGGKGISKEVRAELVYKSAQELQAFTIQAKTLGIDSGISYTGFVVVVASEHGAKVMQEKADASESKYVRLSPVELAELLGTDPKLYEGLPPAFFFGGLKDGTSFNGSVDRHQYASAVKSMVKAAVEKGQLASFDSIGGRVDSVVPHPDGGQMVTYETEAGLVTVHYDHVVIAAGTNPAGIGLNGVPDVHQLHGVSLSLSPAPAA